MGSLTPNPKKRSYLLPPGCKNLIDLLKEKAPKSLAMPARVNGQIGAKEVNVIGVNGEQFGVMSLTKALKLAQSQGIDLVEIAPHAKPPICRIVDYGKFRYETGRQGKRHS